MDLIPGVSNTTGESQSFWDSEYGKWWKRGALATLVAMILIKLGPTIAYLTEIAGNIWILGAHAAGGFVVYKLLTSKKVKTFVDVVLGSFGYFVTDWFIGISPEASGASILELLKGAISRVTKGLETLCGKLEITDNEIKECNKKINSSNSEIKKIGQYAASELEKGGDYDASADEGEIVIHQNEVARYTSLLQELIPFRSDLQGLISDCTKLQGELERTHRDRENELDFLLKKRSIWKDLGAVIESMKQVLSGGNLAAYYERIKSKVKIENDQKAGEMKAFLRNLEPMISKIDRNNAISAKEARTVIEGFMNKNKLISGKKEAVAISFEKNHVMEMPAAGRATDYTEILRKKIEKKD